MKLRRKIALFLTSAMVGTLLFSLSSCSNNRETPEEQEPSHEVTTEAFLLRSDGTMVPFDTEGLRVIDGTKGSITGDGTYYHNQQATIKATAKSPYKLYTLYEKSGFSNLTEAAGKTGITGGTTKTITVNVTQNLHFIAVFMGVDGTDREYRNLKVNGTNSNYTLPVISGASAKSGSVTTVGEEYSPLKDYSGTIVGWELTNATYKAWTAKAPTASWLTVTANSTGTLTYNVTSYISKTGAARTATVQVGKDGIGTGKGVWRTITVKQNSYWSGDTQTPTTPGKVVDASGVAVSLPTSLSHAFPATGGSKDVATLHKALTGPVYALYQVYENGVLQPESKWIKKQITPSYSTAPAWTNVNGTTYAAGKNTTSAARSATVTVTWKVGASTVGTTAIKLSQARVEYNVGGEVK